MLKIKKTFLNKIEKFKTKITYDGPPRFENASFIISNAEA